jgi:hypothetical protein
VTCTPPLSFLNEGAMMGRIHLRLAGVRKGLSLGYRVRCRTRPLSFVHALMWRLERREQRAWNV